MRKRKRDLLILNVTGHIFLLLLYGGLILIALMDFFGLFLIVFYGALSVIMWLLALISLLAMRHIHAS